MIKSHHNVGGLPDYVDFKEIIEPLRDLFKDEVRKAGLELGIPEELVYRQPFPGPDSESASLEKLQQRRCGSYRMRMQSTEKRLRKPDWTERSTSILAALTNMRSVGVMGDERTYDYAVALRAVKTIDFMTAEAAEIRMRCSIK